MNFSDDELRSGDVLYQDNVSVLIIGNYYDSKLGYQRWICLQYVKGQPQFVMLQPRYTSGKNHHEHIHWSDWNLIR